MRASSCPPATSSHHCRLVLFAALLCLLCGDLFAQTANSDYTADLPSVERVEAAIKGTDESDTLARQAAIFNYLFNYIQTIKYNRTVTGPYTPGEARMRNAYELAAYQIEQAYKKNHTAAEVKAWSTLEGRYEINNALDWVHQLSGAQANAAYNNAEAGLARTHEEHEEKMQQQMQQAWGGGSRQGSNGMLNDPTSVAVRRCLELGGTSLGCVGKGFGQGLLGMVGMDITKAFGLHAAGVTMGGLYRSPATVTTVLFEGSSAHIGDCGELVADGHSYHIQKDGRTVEITIQNEPSPIHMFLRADGSLTGPGIVDVKGRIITGYFVNTHTHYGRDCPDGCSSTTRTPNYAPRIERCNIATHLNPPTPAQISAASNAASQLQNLPIVGGLLGMANTIAPASAPGVRMIGEYSSRGGLKLDFGGDAVILDCGQAHVKAPYTVENAPSNFLVHVQNSGGPFTLVVEADNALRGSGSTTVNGRLVSGMSGADVTFTPHSETCNVGTFTPEEPASASTTLTAGPAAAPVPASASPAVPVAPASLPSSAPVQANLRVLIHAQFAGADPLVGQHVIVMRERMDETLRELGLPVPAGTTPGKAMVELAAACRGKNCKPIYAALGKYFITSTTLDANGKAILSAHASTGSYYFFATVRTTKGALVWDVPANLVAGDNTVTLTAANAEVLSK
jgi:hypothetical protein